MGDSRAVIFFSKIYLYACVLCCFVVYDLCDARGNNTIYCTIDSFEAERVKGFLEQFKKIKTQMIRTILYLLILQIVSSSKKISSKPVYTSWLKNFGHDNFQYPDWIAEQKSQCERGVENLWCVRIVNVRIHYSQSLHNKLWNVYYYIY